MLCHNLTIELQKLVKSLFAFFLRVEKVKNAKCDFISSLHRITNQKNMQHFGGNYLLWHLRKDRRWKWHKRWFSVGIHYLLEMDFFAKDKTQFCSWISKVEKVKISIDTRVSAYRTTEKVLAKNGLLCRQFQRKTEPEQKFFPFANIQKK